MSTAMNIIQHMPLMITLNEIILYSAMICF